MFVHTFMHFSCYSYELQVTMTKLIYDLFISFAVDVTYGFRNLLVFTLGTVNLRCFLDQ